MNKKSKLGEWILLNNFLHKIKLDDIPRYMKFNIALSFIILFFIIFININSVLIYANNIIISIGNIFIRILTDKEILPYSSQSSNNILICLFLLLIEIIICRVYCLVAKKFNDKNN